MIRLKTIVIKLVKFIDTFIKITRYLNYTVKRKYRSVKVLFENIARLGQLVEHHTFNLRAMGSIPISG